jgi:predicted MFS family arabinose efflux permease
MGTLSLISVVYGLSEVTQQGWNVMAVVSLGFWIGIGAAFILVEHCRAAPLVPLTIFRRPGLTAGNLVAFLHGASTNTSIVFFALYMQQIRGVSPFTAGLAFLPCNLAVITGAGLGARFVTRRGNRVTMAWGMGIVAAGLITMSSISPNGGYVSALLPGIVVMGLGLGLAQIAVVGAVTGAVGATDRGLASGLVNTSAQIGTAVGLALLVGTAAAVTGAVTEGSAATATSVVAGYQWAFRAGAGIAIVGLLVAFGIGRKQEGWDQDSTEQ